jgi:hypothetical protein
MHIKTCISLKKFKKEKTSKARPYMAHIEKACQFRPRAGPIIFYLL